MEIIIIIIIIIIMPVRSNLYCVLTLARTIDSSYRANRPKRPPVYWQYLCGVQIRSFYVANNVLLVCVCVCVCVCARARAWVRACACVCVRARLYVFALFKDAVS